jgi:hypothetical protein
LICVGDLINTKERLKDMNFFTSNAGKPQAHSNATDAARAAWKRAAENNSRAVIVYVHGRDMKFGKFGGDGEPNSSFKEGIVAELEASNSTVVMLHWPHSVPLLNPGRIPVEDARAAGPQLMDLINSVATNKPNSSQATVCVVTLLIIMRI